LTGEKGQEELKSKGTPSPPRSRDRIKTFRGVVLSSLCPKEFIAFLLEEKCLGFVAREYVSYVDKLG